MGFQIEAHTEVKIDGVWHHYSTPSIDRNYDMFAYLGGEFDRKKHLSLKGLPNDASVVTRITYEHHSHDAFDPSWLSSKEIAEWAIAYPEISLLRRIERVGYDPYQLGFLYGNSTEDFLKYRGDYPAENEDIRIVYWFI